MKKAKRPETVTLNRRARFDYNLGDELTCGMCKFLNGIENSPAPTP